jgi:SAM-dependent methyltransferase
MGSTPKTLERLKYLTSIGALPIGSTICDIGATQLFGDVDQAATRAFLNYYADLDPVAKRPEDVSDEALRAITQKGFLGDLLLLAGFQYTALDIFHATNTILFDLNIHAPGPDLVEKFDLVMNMGTTEHVFNQLRAFQTIHSLTRVGGVCYHDLPMGGYLNHALYRYDPLFFSTVLPVNKYDKLFEQVILGDKAAVPDEMKKIGYSDATYTDVGLEIVYRRTSSDPFRVPLEAQTALSIDPDFWNIAANGLVELPATTSVHYGESLSLDSISFLLFTRIWLAKFKRAVLRRIRVGLR